MAKFEKTKKEILEKKQKHKMWQKLISVLCSVAVFCTVYALVLPAITINNNQSDELGATPEVVVDEFANNIPDELPETINERVALIAYNQLNTNIEDNIYVNWFNNQYEDTITSDNIAFIQYVLNYAQIENNLSLSLSLSTSKCI